MRLILAALLILATPTRAATPPVAPSLSASVIVTGMDLRSRGDGLTRTLGIVLARVSGNPALAADPRLQTLDSAALLASIAYVDRLADRPKHDEQGTRDRPYDLVARFDPTAVEALLASWGERPWTDRPPLAIDATITPRRGPTLTLQADTDLDEPHRAAALAAAARYGLEVWLPTAIGPAPPPPPLRLQARLAWSDAAAGWTATARLEGAGEWRIEGVSFDEAWRTILAGAARNLSQRAATR